MFRPVRSHGMRRARPGTVRTFLGPKTRLFTIEWALDSAMAQPALPQTAQQTSNAMTFLAISIVPYSPLLM